MSDAGKVSERDAIVRDVARLAREAPGQLSARVAALTLREQAEVVLRLPGKERLELLLHAPQPMRLVRSLPDSEIYYTVRDVGPFDALPLLALASAQQLIHLIDLESWRGDRFDADRAGSWAALILESGEPTLIRFLRASDDEQIALLFALWARTREIEEEGEEPEDGFLSPDGQHRFFPTIPEHARAIERIAQILFQDDAHRYARILRLAEWELPSQLEESTLQWRTSRLEEHGFPDFESALSVYGAPEGLSTSRSGREGSADDPIAAPRSALRTRDDAPSVVAWLESLPAETFERVLFELAAVANKILVADHADTGDPAAHRFAMDRAVGFVGIALAKRGVASDEDARRAFEAVPVVDLFREGYSDASELQSAARRFIREGWPTLHPRAMETLDAPIRRSVAALLERRPLAVEPGGVAHGFRSPADLDASRRSLELADLLGRTVTSALRWDLARVLESAPQGSAPPTLGAMWATSMARHAATGELGGGAVTAAVARSFREKVENVATRTAIATAFVSALPAAEAEREVLLRYSLDGEAAQGPLVG